MQKPGNALKTIPLTRLISAVSLVESVRVMIGITVSLLRSTCISDNLVHYMQRLKFVEWTSLLAIRSQTKRYVYHSRQYVCDGHRVTRMQCSTPGYPPSLQLRSVSIQMASRGGRIPIADLLQAPTFPDRSVLLICQGQIHTVGFLLSFSDISRP